MIKKKELVVVAVTIFLTVVAWVLLELQAISDSTPTDTQIESISLDYSIDTQILEELSNKKP